MHMLCLITYMIRSENGSSHAVSEKYEFAENLNWGAKLGENHFFLNPLLRYFSDLEVLNPALAVQILALHPAVQSCLLSISITYTWEVAFYTLLLPLSSEVLIHLSCPGNDPNCSTRLVALSETNQNKTILAKKDSKNKWSRDWKESHQRKKNIQFFFSVLCYRSHRHFRAVSDLGMCDLLARKICAMPERIVEIGVKTYSNCMKKIHTSHF